MIKRIITAILLSTTSLAIPLKAKILPKFNRHSNDASPDQSTDCREIISEIEAVYSIPKNLLAAVAMVESGQKPFAVYARGKSRFFASQEEAVKYVTVQKQKGGNLYVGPMQICMKSHGRAFESVEHALNPRANINFAAKLLQTLRAKHGSWRKAVMYYNASSHRVSYTNRVMKLWGGDENSGSAVNAQKVHKKIRVAFGPGAGIHSK
ncbi:MAG: transglycosylase SLT domain-containing protein [Pseudomonadota bacterium]